MPILPNKVYLLSTAESFSTSLRMWCKRHKNCAIVMARSNDAFESFDSVLFHDKCSQHFIFLKDNTRIDASFAQRLKLIPDNLVVCLFENTPCSESRVAWKLPRSFIELKQISTYADIQTLASKLNLLSTSVAVVKQ